MIRALLAIGVMLASDPVLVISTNTQATVDDVRIAAYNFREEDGERSCALQVFVRDDSSKDQKLRVKAGQSFTASTKSFRVIDVGTNAVSLDVK